MALGQRKRSTRRQGNSVNCAACAQSANGFVVSETGRIPCSEVAITVDFSLLAGGYGRLRRSGRIASTKAMVIILNIPFGVGLGRDTVLPSPSYI